MGSNRASTFKLETTAILDNHIAIATDICDALRR